MCTREIYENYAIFERKVQKQTQHLRLIFKS